MPTSTSSESTISAALRRLDWFRRSPARFGGPAEHKEWQHFLVHTPQVHLLVNFNLIDDPWTVAPAGPPEEVARLIVLVRVNSSGSWDGDTERFEPGAVEVPVGRLDARFGANRMSFSEGRYQLEIALRERAITAELELVPTCLPAIANNQPLAPKRTLSWLFVPRLRARGWIRVGTQQFEVDGAPAYHDHNWGHFVWGDDFAWEWGSAMPWTEANPWSAVYMRMADRARTRASCQGLYLWKGETPGRIFRDHELRVDLHGRLVRTRFLQIPRVMALLCPRSSADLPERFEVHARSGDDQVELVFVPEDLAQVVMPDEARLIGVTALNEVSGPVMVRGRVGGENIEFEGPGVFEFIRDAMELRS
jgi:hypothetical protein